MNVGYFLYNFLLDYSIHEIWLTGFGELVRVCWYYFVLFVNWFFLFCSFTFELLETKHFIFFQFIFYKIILISWPELRVWHINLN
jgi:hypothetical protein